MKNLKLAFAAAALPVCLLIPSTAHASMFGCEVLLCLANPSGPMAVAACVPPISKLYDMLGNGEAFPTCDKSDGNSGDNRAQLVQNPYPLCPEGTTPDQQYGIKNYVVQGTIARNWRGFNETGRMGISAGRFYQNGELKYGALACVGTRIGSYSLYGGSKNDDDITVTVYDRVTFVQPNPSPNAIDVYIENKLHNRIFY